MRLIGFSTGALARNDFMSAIALLKKTEAKAIELSALRESELPSLIDALPNLALSKYDYVSVHAPSRIASCSEEEMVRKLMFFARNKMPIIVHGDLINNFACWRLLGRYLCIENNDSRKSDGRTEHEIRRLFKGLPDASFCFDVAHARQIDPTMSQASLMLKQFADRLCQIHISEINSRGEHGPITYTTAHCCREIARLIPQNIPIIIESVMPAGVPVAGVALEMRRVREALKCEFATRAQAYTTIYTRKMIISRQDVGKAKIAVR